MQPLRQVFFQVWSSCSPYEETYLKILKARVAMTSAVVWRKCHEAGGWTSGGDPLPRRRKFSLINLCVYTHTHTDTHIHTRCHAQTPPTHTLSCTQLYLKYIRLFFMPCPSQMVEEDKEEGNQVNSARQTGCSLQHYWNYFPLLPMEIKENGCDVSAGGRQ